MTTLSFSLPIVFIAASLWSGAVPAQSRAVTGTNFELAATASDVDTSGSTSSGRLDLAVTGTIPLGDYFGTSLSGAYAKTNVRTREILGDGASSPGRPACGFDGTQADLALFARRPALGRVGVSYSENDRAPHTRTIGVGVEYYFGARTSLKNRDREWR